MGRIQGEALIGYHNFWEDLLLEERLGDVLLGTVNRTKIQ